MNLLRKRKTPQLTSFFSAMIALALAQEMVKNLIPERHVNPFYVYNFPEFWRLN